MEKNYENHLLQNMSMEEISQIVKRIIHLRSNILCMTQEQFGTSIGMNQSAISHIESRRRIPSDYFLESVISTYNIRREWLLYGKGEDNAILMDNNEQEKESAIQTLKSAYSLNSAEFNFLAGYLSLPSEQRMAIIEAARIIGGIHA